MADPTINVGQYGHGREWTQTWSDEFDGSQGPLFDRWQPDLMDEGLHQAGNDFNITGGNVGRRWAAWYDKPEECAIESGGALNMVATLTDEPDPGRKSFVFDGTTYNPQNKKIRLAFLTTWGRQFSNDVGGHITDPNSPNRTWGPGTAFEFAVDLSEMRTQCIRISFYLLPAYENDSNAYDPDGTNGIENDFPEIDFLDGFENYAQGKVISSRAAGNTPAGSIDLNLKIPGIDLTQGVHTFTLIWQRDRFVWLCDGVEYQRDTDPRRIPQTAHYIVISREANSGIRSADTPQNQRNPQFAYSDGTPEMPADVGIWGRPCWAEEDTIDGDTAKILYFRSWKFEDNSVPGRGIGDDVSGISPTMSTFPPTQITSGSQFTFAWSNNGRPVSDYYLQVGKTRGGNELGEADTQLTSATITFGQNYNGPVNARLWFRQDSDSEWHWRDFGFSSGLQPYRTGTDGLIRVTTNPQHQLTPPTVAGYGYVDETIEPPPSEGPFIQPNPDEAEDVNQFLTAQRKKSSTVSEGFTQHDWFTLVRGFDPRVMKKEKPSFRFSNGRELTMPVDVQKKTISDD